MAEVALDHAGIDAIIGQFITTGMTQHVRVYFHVENIGRRLAVIDAPIA